MIGVRQYDLGIVRQKVPRLKSLDGGLSADRHEYRRFNISMRKVQNTTPRLRCGIACDNLEPTCLFLSQNSRNYTTRPPYQMLLHFPVSCRIVTVR